MVKIARKLAKLLSSPEDRDSRYGRTPLFVSVLETERVNLQNIGRSWRLR